MGQREARVGRRVGLVTRGPRKRNDLKDASLRFDPGSDRDGSGVWRAGLDMIISRSSGRRSRKWDPSSQRSGPPMVSRKPWLMSKELFDADGDRSGVRFVRPRKGDRTVLPTERKAQRLIPRGETSQIKQGMFTDHLLNGGGCVGRSIPLLREAGPSAELRRALARPP